MAAQTLTNVIPPVKVYAGVGNPHQTTLALLQKNIDAQNALNNKHGGGQRPTHMVVPQAPTLGVNPFSPNTGNSIAAQSSESLLKQHVNSQFDNDVVVPPVPTSQKGGVRPSLLERIKKLQKPPGMQKPPLRKTKKNKSNKGKQIKRKQNGGKTQRHKKEYRKKK
jgi:hypothetical protein